MSLLHMRASRARLLLTLGSATDRHGSLMDNTPDLATGCLSAMSYIHLI